MRHFQDKHKTLMAWAAWPGLMLACMSITYYGFSVDRPILFFNLAYLFLAVSVFSLERWTPHERAWLEPDGQTFASIAHTLTTKGTIQGIFLFGGFIGLVEFFAPADSPDYGMGAWPLALQVVFALIAAEFGLYWAHRAAHEVAFIWRFHAIHHSVTRLWLVNTGRFHFIDSLLSVVLGLAFLLILGAPTEVLQWQAAITAFIGMLTHCNIETKPGPISWIMNTPNLHRWHHSRDAQEANRNYGENVMIWDHVFGTYINPDRRPPVDIGIADYIPPKFLYQLLWPFLSGKQKQKIEPLQPSVSPSFNR